MFFESEQNETYQAAAYVEKPLHAVGASPRTSTCCSREPFKCWRGVQTMYIYVSMLNKLNTITQGLKTCFPHRIPKGVHRPLEIFYNSSFWTVEGFWRIHMQSDCLEIIHKRDNSPRGCTMYIEQLHLSLIMWTFTHPTDLGFFCQANFITLQSVYLR